MTFYCGKQAKDMELSTEIYMEKILKDGHRVPQR